jgi:predicted ATPase
MRVAVSGSHGTGKSTLIAAFLERRRDYVHEPEAYEWLGDDVAMGDDDCPTVEGVELLLKTTLRTVEALQPAMRVILERSPVDYIAYAAASRRTWSAIVVREFLAEYMVSVRAAVRKLDAIVLVPVSEAIPARPAEDERFRRRVDEELRRALIDDDHGIFDGADGPKVLELAKDPSHQLAQLLRLVED